MALKLESSMTDLMTSLAVVFIMLMLALTQNNARGSITKIEEISKKINKELKSDDLSCVTKKDEDPLACTIEVKEDKLKFFTASYTCDDVCEKFLKETFVEQIMKILTEKKFKEYIQGVYIEGFTDDIGDDITNLNLSQNRSLSIGRCIVDYYKKSKTEEEYQTLLKWLYLNGRGEQDLKYDSKKQEINRDASRRVEITIRVKSNEQRAAINSNLVNKASAK